LIDLPSLLIFSLKLQFSLFYDGRHVAARVVHVKNLTNFNTSRLT